MTKNSEEALVATTVNILNPSWQELMDEIEGVVKKITTSTIEATAILPYVNEIEMAVVLADNTFVQNLNAQYRSKDKPTNVLSFPNTQLIPGQYADVDQSLILGDVILALETIKQEASDQDKPFEHHFCHLVLHGTLHLLGYDHQSNDEAEKMEKLEINILEGLGINNPYI